MNEGNTSTARPCCYGLTVSIGASAVSCDERGKNRGHLKMLKCEDMNEQTTKPINNLTS